MQLARCLQGNIGSGKGSGNHGQTGKKLFEHFSDVSSGRLQASERQRKARERVSDTAAIQPIWGLLWGPN
jgi:hypothetical protein